MIRKVMNPRNMLEFMKIARLSAKIDVHLKKRCAYCDENMGRDLPIVDFIKHLKENHPDKIDEKEMKKYEGLL